MKTYRAWLAAVPLALALPAPAQETELTETLDAALMIDAGTLELSSAALATSTTYVAVSGVVNGSPESVRFSGQAKVMSRLARDIDFNRPRLVLSIDLSPILGVGSTSGAKYAIAGPELMHRQVAESHAIEIAFPFRSGSAAPRTGMASFALGFDTSTGAIKSASGSLSTPSFGQ